MQGDSDSDRSAPADAPTLSVARRVAPQAHLVLFHAFRVPFQEMLHFAGVEPSAIDGYRVKANADAR